MKPTTHTAPGDKNRNFSIYFLVPTLNSVRLVGGQISGRLTLAVGEAKPLPNLITNFLNWPTNDEDILRFTKKYGPINTAEVGGGWSFGAEEWRGDQYFMQQAWGRDAIWGTQNECFGVGFDKSDRIWFYKDGHIVLERTELRQFLDDSLHAVPPERMKKCRRPAEEGCDTPYFIANHLHQEYCSVVCSAWAQRASKREWWRRRNEKLKEIQLGEKKQKRKTPIKRSAREMPGESDIDSRPEVAMPEPPENRKPPTLEEIEKIIVETFSLLYCPQYVGDQEFGNRATRLALQALERLPKGSPTSKIRDCISQAIACPEFAWRRYRNWPFRGGYKLYLAPNAGVNRAQKESYFKKDTLRVLAELEKPDKERNLSKLKAGLFLIDRDVELKKLLEENEGAARMILEAYDVRFELMTESMWEAIRDGLEGLDFSPSEHFGQNSVKN
jgi:hypothetical protein